MKTTITLEQKRVRTLFGIAMFVTLATTACLGDEALNPLSKQARESRKAQTFGRFDLDSNGRLDRAERSLLRAELKSKMDPLEKRIIVTTNTPPVRPQ